jgi:hypothetical protein
MEIEDGDIVLLERRVKFNKDECEWVDNKAYTFGHAEIGFIDKSRRINGEEKVTRWLCDCGFTRRGLVTARARVYRSKASASDRKEIAGAVEILAEGADYGIWRANTSIFRSKKATCRGLSGRHWERAMQVLFAAAADKPPHVMKNAFCSELVVSAVQLGAMFVAARCEVTGKFLPKTPSEATEDVDKIFSRAKQHAMWLDTRAKATTPSGLEQVLRSSANWEYLGLYTDSDDAEDFIRLKSVIVRAMAHYNDRTTMGVFKWTSTATSAAMPVLRWLTTSPHSTAAYTRYGILRLLPGVTLSPGKQSAPWAEGNLMPNLPALDKGSRLYRCLLLAVAQGAGDQFQFDAKEVDRVRLAP